MRVRSGVQCTVGLSANLPFGSTVIRNSVAEVESIEAILLSGIEPVHIEQATYTFSEC